MLLPTSRKLLSAMALPLGLVLSLNGGPVVEGLTAGLEAPPAQAEPVSYATEVQPILEQYCYSCHGGMGEDGELREELGFNLTTYAGLMTGSTYGTVIEAGDPDNSLLIEMIVAGDMPEEGDPVPPELIEVLRNWIAEGALDN